MAARNPEPFAHSSILLEAACGQQHAAASADPHLPAIALNDDAGHRAVIHDEVDQWRVKVHGGVREAAKRGQEAAKRGQEAADQGATTGEQFRRTHSEALVVQRSAHPVGVRAEGVRGQRPAHDVAHPIQSGAWRASEVVGPGQHLEREGVVGLEVLDQSGSATNVGVRHLARRPVADHGVEVRQCLSDGVVDACAAQHRVAREPHSTAAGECRRPTELVTCLDQRDGQAFACRGVRAGDAATRADDDHVDGLAPAR